MNKRCTAEWNIPNIGGIYRCTLVEGHNDLHGYDEKQSARWRQEEELEAASKRFSSRESPVIAHGELLPDELSAHVINCNDCAQRWNHFVLNAYQNQHNMAPLTNELIRDNPIDIEALLQDMAKKPEDIARPVTEQMVSMESILDEAARIVNGPRAESYGPPKKNFKDIAYGWCKILGVKKKIRPEQVALCMIWLKIMRFQNGKPDRDSIVDIAGYAQTVEKIIPLPK